MNKIKYIYLLRASRTERFELGKVLSRHLWPPAEGSFVCNLKKSHESVEFNQCVFTWHGDKLCNRRFNAFFVLKILFLARKLLDQNSFYFFYLNRLSATAFSTHLFTPSAISSLKITVFYRLIDLIIKQWHFCTKFLWRIIVAYWVICPLRKIVSPFLSPNPEPIIFSFSSINSSSASDRFIAIFILKNYHKLCNIVINMHRNL